MDKELIFSYLESFVITDGILRMKVLALIGESVSSKLELLVKCF